MRSPDPYRHSVWIDVSGILLAGAVLLGGAAYLLSHAGSATTGLRAASPQRGGQAATARSARRAPARPRPSAGDMFSSRSRPLVGDRSAPAGTAAPFSKGWREQAAPNLTGPSPEGGAPLGGGASAGGAASSGPAIASSPSLEDPGHGSSRRFQSEGASGGPSWRRDARKLAGRARALSGQLRQLEREAAGSDQGESASDEKTAGEATTASASTNDRDTPTPPSVPIDDHLHWLVVAGLLWGIWRLAQP